eukprot:2638070-Rhodomonas_salina.1
MGKGGKHYVTTQKLSLGYAARKGAAYVHTPVFRTPSANGTYRSPDPLPIKVSDAMTTHTQRLPFSDISTSQPH